MNKRYIFPCIQLWEQQQELLFMISHLPNSVILWVPKRSLISTSSLPAEHGYLVGTNVRQHQTCTIKMQGQSISSSCLMVLQTKWRLSNRNKKTGLCVTLAFTYLHNPIYNNCISRVGRAQRTDSTQNLVGTENHPGWRGCHWRQQCWDHNLD